MTKQAFKAWWYNEGSQAPYTHHDCEEHTMRMCEIAWNKAQALAQPEDPCKGANYSQASEQEPVCDKDPQGCWSVRCQLGNKCKNTPPQRTEQEPLEYWNAVEGWVKIDEVREHFDSVGCGTIYKSAGEGRAPLYTTPPQRKPLTDEMKKQMRESCDSHEMRGAFVDGWLSAEAAHGIWPENSDCYGPDWTDRDGEYLK